MSLAPDEQRTLTQIENELSRSDPRLAAMFTRFSAEHTRTRHLLGALPRYGPRPGGRARMIILIAASLTLLIACVSVAVVVASRPAQPRGGSGPAVSPISAYISGR
jgi:hypothetical protein